MYRFAITSVAVLGIVAILFRLASVELTVTCSFLAIQLMLATMRGRLARRGLIHIHATFLGVLVILFPAFSPMGLLASLLMFAIFELDRRAHEPLIVAQPLIIVSAGWVVVELLAVGEGETLQQLWWSQPDVWGRLIACREFLQSHMPAWYRAFQWMLRIIVIFSLYSIFASDHRLRQSFAKGVCSALLVALPLTSLQVWMIQTGHVLSDLIPARNEYWDRLGRVQGTFSDPNAFGIALFLSIPMILSLPIFQSKKALVRVFLWAFLLAWGTLGLFSGSRTFVLGIVLALWGALYIRRKFPALLLLAMAGGALLALNSSNLWAAHVASFSEFMPESLRRVSSSLMLHNIADSFFSRTLFIHVAGSIFSASPWLGVGLGKFQEFVVPLIAGTPGVPRLWIDNSNNFYLGVAAELGIVGIGALFGILYALRFRLDASAHAKSSVAVFALLLFFGPHLEFNEVAALFGVVLAFTVSCRAGLKDTVQSFAALALLPLLFLKAQLSQSGFYGWEDDGTRYFRWTGPVAQGWIHCDSESNKARIYLRAARGPSEAVAVEVRTSNGGKEVLTLQGDEMQFVEFVCAEIADTARVMSYRITVKNPWIPKLRPGQVEGRILGVQVLTREPGRTLPF